MTTSKVNNGLNEAEAKAKADFFKVARGEGGISVGQVAGVVGGVLGALYMVSEGSNKTAAVIGGAVGAVCGWAAGNAIDIIEVAPGATTKILSGAVACSFGASFGMLATQLVGGMVKTADM